MMAPILRLERLTRVTLLGLRFWDSVSGRVVGDGLVVTASPADNPSGRTQATTNRSGVYVFQNLPGLREVEYGEGNAAFWANPPKRSFLVEVLDGQGRFQPFSFNVDAPVRDLFMGACSPLASPPASPPTTMAAVPLYSTPNRPVPAGMAVIRADLWDAIRNKPAAWAVVEVRFQSQLLARGLADQEGRIAIIFPYPEPSGAAPSSPPTSPPIGNRPPLTEQAWAVQPHAFYTPLNPVPEIPDLCQTLEQTPATLLFTLSPPSPLPQPEVTLHFGKELVVKSQSQSVLWIA